MGRDRAGMRWMAGLVMALGLGFNPATSAGHGLSPGPAHGPSAPQEGSFFVNSSADSNAADSVLSLREALLVANGTLSSGLTAGEQAQLGGCSFSGGAIVGGCGANITDTIMFASPMTITLASPLPAISDAQPTLLYACYSAFACAVIDAAGAGPGADGLTVSSSRNQLYGVRVRRSPRDGIRVSGNANTLIETAVISSTDVGLHVMGGDGNRLIGSVIGLIPPASPTCAPNGVGVRFSGGANDNTLTGGTIACNTGSGVDIVGSTGNVVGGSSTLIGLSGAVKLPNGTGVVMRGGSAQNVLTDTIVAYSLGHGVLLDAVAQNDIVGSTIAGNGLSGVALYNAAQTAVGPRYPGPGGPKGNRISGNGAHGVVISGSLANQNLVFGNAIGNFSGYPAAPITNTLDGVHVRDGAYLNLIGGLRLPDGSLSEGGNVIAGNGRAGVRLIAGANDNFVQGNDIGRSAGATLPVMNADGVVVDFDAYDNVIGGYAADAANVVAGNGTGIALLFASRNLVASNRIGVGPGLGNASGGLTLFGALTNTVEQNVIAHNVVNGVDVLNFSRANEFIRNTVIDNGARGFFLATTSTLNTITATVIADNGGQGILAASGPNFWSRLSVYANGGLGIDTQVQGAPNPPTATIRSVNRATGGVTGTASPTAFLVFTAVELYRLAPDPSGYGEGAQFVGRAFTDAAGNWSITDPEVHARRVGCYTVLVDIAVLVPLGTSEFGANNCRSIIFAPATQRGAARGW